MSAKIAVLGASASRRKFGNKCVRAYLQAGYEVFPVNPHEELIEGLKVYRNLQEIPVKLDRISVYLPPATTSRVLLEIAAVEADQVWFNPGSCNPSILELAAELGVAVQDGCSIVDIGISPSSLD